METDYVQFREWGGDWGTIEGLDSYDRFCLVEAHYAHAMENHGGQGSELYRKLCTIGEYFNPSPMWSGYESLDETSQEIYNDLKES